jgi:hypothetical protein
MPEPNQAIFLSYASQDAEAAQSICQALRAGGIEVWFDRSALRGGDAWDQKIRREIRECALFMPVISSNTQARHEGYFRLEWRLADQRTHLMGKTRAFLVPVCVDATRDAGADVPDSFAEVQWTRLPEGQTPAAFVERVRHLLTPDPSPDTRAAPAPAPRRRRARLMAAGVTAATLLLMGRNAEALAEAQKETNEENRLQKLALVYWAVGRQADSDMALSQLEANFANEYSYDIGEVHAYRGEAEAANRGWSAPMRHVTAPC